MRKALVVIATTFLSVFWLLTYKATPHGITTSAGSTTQPNGSGATYTGQDANTIFGDVQVQITVSGGHVTEVQALRLPFDRQRSAEISQYAGPQLRQEAITAQSAQIAIISGATYTSLAYRQSLLSALQQAHLA